MQFKFNWNLNIIFSQIQASDAGIQDLWRQFVKIKYLLNRMMNSSEIWCQWCKLVLMMQVDVTQYL